MDPVILRAQQDPAVSQPLVQALALIPGWEEKNFQVAAKAFEAIRAAAGAGGEFGRREAFVSVVGATDKMADIKLKVRVLVCVCVCVCVCLDRVSFSFH